MRIVDLTHTVREGMPIYPGTEAPHLLDANTLERDGFRETKLEIFSHVGTHIDAPAHLIADGVTLDALPASQFVGRALVIDCRTLASGEPITLAQILSYGEDAERADFLLFCTGYDAKWGSDAYFDGFPCLDDAALDYVIRGKYKGIGSDTISMDPMSDVALPRHKKLLSSRPVINVENLRDLSALVGEGLVGFACLPLKFENADGAPARAIATME